MSPFDSQKSRLSRRRFLASGVMAAAASGLGAQGASATGAGVKQAHAPWHPAATEPFFGPYQGGILTPLQPHTYFAAFDVITHDRDELIKMLRAWTDASARMAAGQTAAPLGANDAAPAPDSGEALGLSPGRLTITFGLGAGLFVKDGQDRYGLAGRRPAALVELPKFSVDQLVDSRTGGDLSVQACAEHPQVAFHAVRQLARLAANVAKIRWVQSGFTTTPGTGDAPRNLLGFKDGTNNLAASDGKAMDQFVWVGSEGPEWMRGGSYVVVRRVRFVLEVWDRMSLAFQEQTFGRKKYSGAPLTGKKQLDRADYGATDRQGRLIIPANSHARQAAAGKNGGAQILRRPYSYNDGVNFTAERWPPFHGDMEYDAGLLFVCYQRDPRTGFIRLFEKLSQFDALNQFVIHTGGGLFACPGGVSQDGFIGQRLFEQG